MTKTLEEIQAGFRANNGALLDAITGITDPAKADAFIAKNKAEFNELVAELKANRAAARNTPAPTHHQPGIDSSAEQ